MFCKYFILHVTTILLRFACKRPERRTATFQPFQVRYSTIMTTAPKVTQCSTYAVIELCIEH